MATRRPAPPAPGPGPREESWFGALDFDEPAPAASEESSGAESSGTFVPRRSFGAAPSEPMPLTRDDPQDVRAAGAAAGGTAAFERLYRVFIGARAVLGVLLLAAQGLLSVLAAAPQALPIALCALYAAAAVLVWAWPVGVGALPVGRNAPRKRSWLLTVGVDLSAFVALQSVAADTQNYGALFAMPVLMAGVLMPRRMAQAVAALATFFLLGVAWWRIAGGGDPGALLTQAGMVGGGLFAISLLAGEVAQRLAREERTVRSTMELARQQAQLNRLVIDEMQEGVLVVDRRGRVRAANPAARALLVARGMAEPAPFPLHGMVQWLPLVQAMERAFAEGAWPQGGRDVKLDLPDEGDGAVPQERHLRLRMRFTRRREGRESEDLCVLFIEDLRTVQARARQEKLAAMGRVSAGIAHEIRNPLAAIAQANALLGEDVTTPGMRQLTQMVSDNVDRLKRIVDDVLEVAPGVQLQAQVIDVAALTGAICVEWAQTARVPFDAQGPLTCDLGDEPLGARFEPDHLRRVLVNLLDNAYRHGTRTQGAIAVRLAPQGVMGLVLEVGSDGEPIAANVEPYLFEPFFSTRSRGSGLGLYICRELCERYGASIEYRARGAGQRHRNVFVVSLPREGVAGGEPRLQPAS